MCNNWTEPTITIAEQGTTYLLQTDCSHDVHVNATTPWVSAGLNIEYCLSQLVDEHCKVQFGVVIMVIVVSCNFAKMIIMGCIAWKRPVEPLVTLGDAIASFLDEPDVMTRGNSLAGKERFWKNEGWREVIATWNPRPRRWFRGTSTRRFYSCNLL